MKIVAEHPLEIGYHTASWGSEVSSEYCGATSFLLQEGENDHLITLGLVAKSFGAGSHALRTDHLAALVLRRHFSQSTSTDMVNLLTGALEEANQTVIAREKAFPTIEGPRGVALAVAVVFGRELYVANIGDCRIYLRQRGSPLIRITFDHKEPVRSGGESATAHPIALGPERFLGQGPEVRPDFRMRLQGGQDDRTMIENQGTKLQPGDKLLLVSAGVATALSDSRIEGFLKRDRPERAARQLTRAALAHPGVETASALVMHLPDDRTAAWTSLSRSIRRYSAWVLAALLLLAGAVLGAPQARSPMSTGTPAATLAATDMGMPAVPATTDQVTPSPGPVASATRDYVSVYTRPPLPTDTLPAPSPTVTASPTPTATPTATATPRPTRRPPSITPSPSVTPSDTPAPPRQPTKTPIPQPTHTAPPPPTDTPIPTPLPSATPRPTLTAPRPTLTPE